MSDAAAAGRGRAAGGAMPARLGVLGGTFDPPHLGHLALARHALQELALDRVLLMPARHSPHKPPAPAGEGDLHATAAERLEMCRLIASEEPRVDASDLELGRDGPSYTVDTLRELHARSPVSLAFILGADVARTLPTWREPRELLRLAELAVAVRAGTAEREVREALAPLLAENGPPRARARARGEGDQLGGVAPSAEGGVRFLSMPAVEVSSSLVRERVGLGAPVVELVGARVAAYVEARGLYRARLAGASAR